MRRRTRIALALAALLLVGWSVARYVGWAREQSRLATLLERLDAARPMPGLPQHVERANDPIEARLRAGRALVAYFLDPTWVYELPEAERAAAWERSLDALGEIRQMAAATLVERPLSWQAAMLYGASAYLLERRPGVATSSRIEAWERPLERAAALIPSYLEPVRYLAVAYVNHWQSLSIEQRHEARRVLARAFEDPRTFELTIEAWLRLVPDRREALALVPDRSFAWSRLEEIFRRRGEWSLYLESRRRFRAAEAARLDEMLEEAEARVAGGDFRRGTTLFHRAIASLEPNQHNLPAFRRILERMPPGPVDAQARPALRGWLEWSLRLGFLRGSPLEADLLERLLGSVDDLRLDELALGRILASDLPGAQRAARRHSGALGPEWGPYLVLEAEALLERGELETARRGLAAVRPPWREHPTFLRVSRRAALAADDAATAAAVEATLADLARERWSGAEMVWKNDIARLELMPRRAAAGLEIVLIEGRPEGQPLEVWWNGRLVALLVAYPDTPFRVEFELAAEPSLLELGAPDRRPFVPGTLTLLGPSS